MKKGVIIISLLAALVSVGYALVQLFTVKNQDDGNAKTNSAQAGNEAEKEGEERGEETRAGTDS